MEFVPELIDGGVILNPTGICPGMLDCRACQDLAIGVHNWLVSTDIKYLIVDFQDEKEVCPSIIIELLQLRKRLRYPFLFVGMMDKARGVLDDYSYADYPVFDTPEQAVAYMREKHKPLLEVDFAMVQFGDAIPTTRIRQARGEVEEVEETQEAED